MDGAGLRCFSGRIASGYEIEELCRGLVVCVEECDQDSHRVLSKNGDGEIIAQVTPIVERVTILLKNAGRFG